MLAEYINHDFAPWPVTDEDLARRFESETVSKACKQYLKDGEFGDITEQLDGKNYAIGLIRADDHRFRDIGKSLETSVFANVFGRTMSEVYEEYEKYDSVSTFITVIDVSDIEHPRPAGALRVIQYSAEKGLKSIEDMVVDSEANPWLGEIKRKFFLEGEQYDSSEAWARLCAQAGVELKAEESHDIATLAIDPEYASNGAMDGVSIRLYHSCLRYALGNNMKNLVSIQDLRPFMILQSFGQPFETFDGLTPHPYGGPYDTIPAYGVIDSGMAKIRNFDELTGKIFIDGLMLEDDTLLLQHQRPSQYADGSIYKTTQQGLTV